MIEVLHLIEGLSLGGGARAVLASAKYSARLGDFRHKVISLLPADPKATKIAQQADVTVYSAPSREVTLEALSQADIVQIDWWNSPILNEILYSELPPIRLVIWFHVGGDSPLQVITSELVDLSDLAIAACPYSYSLPVFRKLPKEVRGQKVRMIYAPADFERLRTVKQIPHSTFNVGYIGTLDFVKLHPMYATMSAAVSIPDVRFIVCGDSYFGDDECLFQQVELLNRSPLFDFRGYVDDIQSVLGLFDVYGYPLCENTYAAAELNLQEVMFAGVPPVVFPHGGVKDLIVNGETGLIVHNKLEYSEAVEHLYHNPRERYRLGRNASLYARQVFGGENTARDLNRVYESVMSSPKLPRARGIKHEEGDSSSVALQCREISGAELFTRFTGDYREAFRKSLVGHNVEEVMTAEQTIATSASVRIMRSAGYGSVMHYRDHYPDDGYLQLWVGLQLQYRKQFEAALSAFQAAIDLGCDHWRVYWYAAQAAERCGRPQEVEQAARAVTSLAPCFRPAEELLQRTVERQVVGNHRPGASKQTPIDQEVELPPYISRLIEVFEHRIYDYRSPLPPLGDSKKRFQVDTTESDTAEFLDLMQQVDCGDEPIPDQYELFRLAKQVCRTQVLGNFVQYAETRGISTIILAYVLKRFSRVPRLLYMTSPGVGTDSNAASECWVETTGAKLGLSGILKTTEPGFRSNMADNHGLLGMIALLHVSNSRPDLPSHLADMVSNQLVGGGVIVCSDRAGCRTCYHNLSEELRASCPPILSSDTNAIWPAKKTKFPKNPTLPLSIVSAFQEDDLELRYVLSQMSTNERFQIHFVLSRLLEEREEMPVRFIEIGSYAGASLMLTYRALRRRFAAVQGYAIEPRTHPQLSSAIQETEGEIVHLRMRSKQAAPLLHERFGQEWASFILVDGDHSYEAVSVDIKNYYPFLKPGGILLFHDFLPPLNSHNRDAIMIQHAGRAPGVRRACRELLEQSDHYQCEIRDAPLLYPSDPTQSQAHLPIVPSLHSTIRVYQKRRQQ